MDPSFYVFPLKSVLGPHPWPPLILASGSPRRKELLASLGLTFDVVSPPIDEASIPVEGLSPEQVVLTLAQAKGSSVASTNPDHLVIAADTIVVVNGVLLGKPTDTIQAYDMLAQLQGQAHSVWTGIAVFYQGRHAAQAVETKVFMKPLNDSQIQAYVASGEPMDKAGAYAIQGFGSTLIERIEGCYFNVVGLSLERTVALVNQLLG